MPLILGYGCDSCEFEMPSGWGCYCYATDANGNRVVCGHPGEFEAVQRITRLTFDEAEKAGRFGRADHCICLDCLKQFDLDIEKDSLVCPACGSGEVRTELQLVGQPCPACKTGVFDKRSLYRWKLDPDWETLPVPNVVKELLSFVNDRKPPESLERAFDELLRGGGDFELLALWLLNWWEGEYGAPDPEPKDFFVLKNPKGGIAKGLPIAISCVPELGELVVIEKDRWTFGPNVTAEIKRGIKNYIRKHRFHWAMC